MTKFLTTDFSDTESSEENLNKMNRPDNLTITLQLTDIYIALNNIAAQRQKLMKLSDDPAKADFAEPVQKSIFQHPLAKIFGKKKSEPTARPINMPAQKYRINDDYRQFAFTMYNEYLTHHLADHLQQLATTLPTSNVKKQVQIATKAMKNERAHIHDFEQTHAGPQK